MIAVIGGTSLLDLNFLENLSEEFAENSYGRVYLLKNREIVFLPRHGRDRRIPPHRINHRANIMALSDLGVERIIGVGCAGSLKKEITPRSILIPNDYLHLEGLETFFDAEIKHITPCLDESLREGIIESARKSGMKVFEGGVYAQTRGPRLETKAEVSFLRDYADVVGMTMASEATLSQELEIPYACICTVDNYAHGITDETLDFEEIVKTASKNREDLKKLLKSVIEELK
jgi:5'-methylthioadenosine phosphorylase